jgi:hypothetical protein
VIVVVSAAVVRGLSVVELRVRGHDSRQRAQNDKNSNEPEHLTFHLGLRKRSGSHSNG